MPSLSNDVLSALDNIRTMQETDEWEHWCEQVQDEIDDDLLRGNFGHLLDALVASVLNHSFGSMLAIQYIRYANAHQDNGWRHDSFQEFVNDHIITNLKEILPNYESESDSESDSD